MKMNKNKCVRIVLCSLFSLVFMGFFSLVYADNMLSDAETQAVVKIEKYLNQITTMQADFSQLNPDGKIIKGKFLLSRPGKLKFTYENGNFIVADGSDIFFWDNKMERQSQQSIDSSITGFLLKKNLSLSGDVKVNDIELDDSEIRVNIALIKNPDAGVLKLFFAPSPIQIVGWELTDQARNTTKILLTNIVNNPKLDKKLFYFYRPKKTGK